MPQEPKRSGHASAQQWYLTAQYRQIIRRPESAPKLSAVHDEPLELPFGVTHVQRFGAAFTACGMPAHRWPIFWHLDISEADTICPACASAVQ